MRVQNEGTGKSSWWIMNPDAVSRTIKTVRRPRAMTMDTAAAAAAGRGNSSRLSAAYERHRRRSSATQLHHNNIGRVASSSSSLSSLSSSPAAATVSTTSTTNTVMTSSNGGHVASLSLQHSYSSSGIDRLPTHPPTHHHPHPHHFMLPPAQPLLPSASDRPPDASLYGQSECFNRSRAASFGGSVSRRHDLSTSAQFTTPSASSETPLSETLADIFAGDLNMEDMMSDLPQLTPQCSSESSSCFMAAGVPHQMANTADINGLRLVHYQQQQQQVLILL